MTKCAICESVFKSDIEQMISAGSNNKYVQQWCKERKFKITLKAIETHKLSHLNHLEKATQKLDEVEAIYLTIGEIEEQLDLPYDCLLPYLDANNLKLNPGQPYDVIDIMSYSNLRSKPPQRI